MTLTEPILIVKRKFALLVGNVLIKAVKVISFTDAMNLNVSQVLKKQKNRVKANKVKSRFSKKHLYGVIANLELTNLLSIIPI